MSTAYEIPLTPDSQTFKISLGGVNYQISLWWNDIAKNWNFDIISADGMPIINSIPLVPGPDLLEQYSYLNFGGSLVVQVDGDIYANPTYENLGSSAIVYFIIA